MDLPASQTALLSRLADTNPNLAVVLANGSAVRLADWEQHAKAVLECWLSARAPAGGRRPAAGAANPSGRLAETLRCGWRTPRPTSTSPVRPATSATARASSSATAATTPSTARSATIRHGLSYTSFGYTDLTTNVTGRPRTATSSSTSCRATNTGDRRGKEVVQLYVGDPEASVARPVRELKAFAKVDLDPGQATMVEFALTARDLSWWSTTLNDWALEGGQFELAVGASSRDLRLTTTVDVAAPPYRPGSTACPPSRSGSPTPPAPPCSTRR